MPIEKVPTAEYILATVAPIFNRYGYIGTSLSDLTRATGLTKGALYGNFRNKEELALQAFELNISRAIKPMYDFINEKKKGWDKLYAVAAYHRKYYDLVKDQGGCPLIRVGMDAKFNNRQLYQAAKRSMQKLLKGLANILKQCQKEGSVANSLDVEQQAKLIYVIIEGSLVSSFNHNNRSFIDEAMTYLEETFFPALKK